MWFKAIKRLLSFINWNQSLKHFWEASQSLWQIVKCYHLTSDFTQRTKHIWSGFSENWNFVVTHNYNNLPLNQRCDLFSIDLKRKGKNSSTNASLHQWEYQMRKRSCQQHLRTKSNFKFCQNPTMSLATNLSHSLTIKFNKTSRLSLIWTSLRKIQKILYDHLF